MTNLTNLLEETLEVLKNNKYEESDIDWVGSADGVYAMRWKRAKPLLDVNYDAGYGSAEIATDLVIVFKDGRGMYRGEYDGSEWWNVSPVYKKSSKPKSFDGVKGYLWNKLEVYQTKELSQ